MIPILIARGLSPLLAKLLAYVALPLLVIGGAYLLGDHNGANRVKARVAAERAAANVTALTTDVAAKEQAATERANDTTTTTDIQREQVNAIHGETDADIRRNAACARLRQARGDQAAISAGC
jgi:predicted DNA repair protein MutK